MRDGTLVLRPQKAQPYDRMVASGVTNECCDQQTGAEASNASGYSLLRDGCECDRTNVLVLLLTNVMAHGSVKNDRLVFSQVHNGPHLKRSR